ncbi:hypothetical protein F4821DRAFT_251651 [Hypoxylon rubiginosum]|uniref:Uncharacterized protein n=1 Tax=Hypoxylon rubiginosum TaxID=110542 RepID=A0ACC0CJ39_9PEZI|nr:hypothetical protein F4821DRAFT_251651 [Hypoxylon rubiginosum]
MNHIYMPPPSSIDQTVFESLFHNPKLPQAHFTAFVRFYRNSLAPAGPLSNTSAHSLASPSAIIQAVETLKCKCHITKDTLMEQLFPHMTRSEQGRSLRTLIQITFMLDTASSEIYSDACPLHYGEAFPVIWDDSQSLADFIQSTLSPSTYQITESHNKLKAWKLKHRHGIQIVPTNDLIQHLLYDSRTQTLTVFHQVAWLKAQLRHAAKFSDTGTTQEFLARGVLPPQILRETLYSIYRILFPLDEKSAKFARRLVAEHNGTYNGSLDDSLLSDPGEIHDIAKPFEFAFWGKRLKRLEDIVAHPPPTNALISWFERHTSERNALSVAIVGVFFAAFFGLLGVLVSAAQLVVSYYAWKYPA